MNRSASSRRQVAGEKPGDVPGQGPDDFRPGRLLYRGLGAKARRAAARSPLLQAGVDGWEQHSPADLSGGQQQRVAIARAIVTEPVLLLADEPTGNLDSARGHEIMGLLSRLQRERGLSVLMVTHEPEMAAYAGRVVRFHDGRVVADERQVPRSGEVAR